MLPPTRLVVLPLFLLLSLLPSASPSRFLILQWATAAYRTEWAAFLDQNRRYAERRGYGYILLGAHDNSDGAILRALNGRPVHWGKVVALRSIFGQLSPVDAPPPPGSSPPPPPPPAAALAAVEYVLWLDADCLVVNFEQRLEPFAQLDAHAPRVVTGPPHCGSDGGSDGDSDAICTAVLADPAPPWDLITTDANVDGSFHVNNGAMLLRNSRWSRRFLQLWWQQSPLPNSTVDWFAHDQGGWWNALLLAEFPSGLYDDRCASGASGLSPLVSYELSACVEQWLRDFAKVRFRGRRFRHTLLVDPYRHLQLQRDGQQERRGRHGGGGGGRGGDRDRDRERGGDGEGRGGGRVGTADDDDDDDGAAWPESSHIRGLHFWSALTVATRSPVFHPCSHEDHFEAGDFIVQTKNPHEAECGGPCWANSWMGEEVGGDPASGGGDGNGEAGRQANHSSSSSSSSSSSNHSRRRGAAEASLAATEKRALRRHGPAQ